MEGPIKIRLDMLTTGIRTPIGIKIYGPSLDGVQEIGKHIEGVIGSVPGTRNVYAERVVGGFFIDFEIDRDKAARYGLSVDDISASWSWGRRRNAVAIKLHAPRAL